MMRWQGRGGRGWLAGCALLLMAAASPPAAAEPECPGLEGHYRVDGFGPVLGDALGVLGLGMAGFRDSEVQITGDAEQSLSFRIKSGSSSPMASRPSRVLTRGVDYDCAAGALTLRSSTESTRQTDAGFLEGRSVLRLRRSGAGLGLAVEFSGGQRSTLYSYDSARISVPRPGTGRTLHESIRWPGIQEPRPASARPYEPAPESAQVGDLRRRLDALLGGAVRVGGLDDSGGRVRASLSASQAEDVVAFEDRLRAAGLPYTTTRAPIWTNNQYFMEFLFGADAGAAARGWHPSVFRVQHEIDRLCPPMISVRKVEDAGDGYVAELDVIGDESPAPLLQRLRAGTTMFRDVELLDDAAQTDRRNLRRVRLRLKTASG